MDCGYFYIPQPVVNSWHSDGDPIPFAWGDEKMPGKDVPSGLVANRKKEIASARRRAECAVYKYSVGQKVLVVDDRDYAGMIGVIVSREFATHHIPNRTMTYYEVRLPGLKETGLTFWEEDIVPLTEAVEKSMREEYLWACQITESGSGSGSTNQAPGSTESSPNSGP